MAFSLKTDGKWLLLIALTVFCLFANSLSGEFVYDDKRQLLMNPLVQEPSLFSKALTTDVWAFKGDGNSAASNYWRPTFTAFCILNFQLFGQNPLGWHLLNILLHVGVCLLSFLLLRRWGLSEMVAFCISLIFAVHPVHTESVAWIAGSPDLLFALSMLASLWFADKAVTAKAAERMKFLAAAVVFYILALGSKEVGIFLFSDLLFHLFGQSRGCSRQKGKAGGGHRNDAHFCRCCGCLFSYPTLDPRPRVAARGQRRICFNHRAVGSADLCLLSAADRLSAVGRAELWAATAGFGRADYFFVPLAITLVAAYAIWRLFKMSFVQRIGAALFVFPLLSIFNITVFLPEQIVHDRYLYLPLLGFLMMTVPFAAEMLKKYFAGREERILTIVAVVLCIPLALQTFTYNRVWLSEIALWRYAVTVDPQSSFNWSALGSELSEQEKTDEAIAAYSKSLAIFPRPLAYIGRAQNLIKKGDLDTPIKDLRTVIATSPDNLDAYTWYQAYETLAIALQAKPSLDDAEKVLREGRKKLPIYQAAMTEKIAVILYLQNKKPEALSELERQNPLLSESCFRRRRPFFLRLGMLYSETGNKAAAIENLNLYLQSTRSAKDKETDNERQQAGELLKRLR